MQAIEIAPKLGKTSFSLDRRHKWVIPKSKAGKSFVAAYCSVCGKKSVLDNLAELVMQTLKKRDEKILGIKPKNTLIERMQTRKARFGYEKLSITPEEVFANAEKNFTDAIEA